MGKFSDAVPGRSTRLRLAEWLDHLLFWALLVVLCLAALPNPQLAKLTEAFGVSAVFLLGLLRVIEGGLRGSWCMRNGQLFLPLLLLALFAFTQTIPLPALILPESETPNPISADPYGTSRFVSYFLAYLLFGEFLLRYTSNQRRLSLLVHLLVGIGVALALVALINQSIHWGSDGLIHVQLKRTEFYGHLGNRNHFSLLMAMLLGLSLGLILRNVGPRRVQPLYVLSSLVIWLALIVTNSRGGILSMFAQQLFCLLFLTFTIIPSRPASSSRSNFASLLSRPANKWALRIALIAVITALSILSVVWVGGDTLVDRVETAQTDLSTRIGTGNEKEGRIKIWRATLKLIKERPVTGSGFGGYWIAISRYYEATSNAVPHKAHSDYLDLLASGGVVAVALVGWFFILWLRKAYAGLFARDHLRRAASFGALAGLSAVAIHSAFDFGLQLPTNALIFTTLLAIPLMDSKVEKAIAPKEINA